MAGAPEGTGATRAAAVVFGVIRDSRISTLSIQGRFLAGGRNLQAVELGPVERAEITRAHVSPPASTFDFESPASLLRRLRYGYFLLSPSVPRQGLRRHGR
jgi:hypothetical protein